MWSVVGKEDSLPRGPWKAVLVWTAEEVGLTNDRMNILRMTEKTSSRWDWVVHWLRTLLFLQRAASQIRLLDAAWSCGFRSSDVLFWLQWTLAVCTHPHRDV